MGMKGAFFGGLQPSGQLSWPACRAAAGCACSGWKPPSGCTASQCDPVGYMLDDNVAPLIEAFPEARHAYT